MKKVFSAALYVLLSLLIDMRHFIHAESRLEHKYAKEKKILLKNKIFLKTISQTLPCILKKCFINHNRFLINTQLRSLTPATLN